MSEGMTLPKGTIVPDHLAIILDGNGRWARSRGLRVTDGHAEGAKAVRKVLDAARSLGVHTVTLWGFSTENWKRPPAEKTRIFSLIKNYLQKEIETAKKEKIRFIHIGRKDRLPRDLMKMIGKAEDETRHFEDHVINIALDYGGRDEILRAVKRIVNDKVPAEKIDEDVFASYLDTADQPYPYPDLFIRTSGEQRTSGYLPWQMVYSEFYFEQCHLPDMTPEKLKEAILDYSRRRRRFGAKDKVKHLTFDPKITARLELDWWRLSKVPRGQKLTQFAVEYLRQQYGLSKKLALQAAKYLVEATIYQDKASWEKAKKPLKKFYALIKDHLKLAFEPELVAGLEVRFWRDATRENAQELYAEAYRISFFQAAKLAHLRVLASVERNLALATGNAVHWEKAQDYLQRFYAALKDKVA